MPSVIDPETMQVDSLPVVWSPVQSQLAAEERAREVEEQATASLLWAADAPEAILRLLLGETAIVRVFDAPQGYDPDQQGEWDPRLVTFAFARPIRLLNEDRRPDRLALDYKLEGAGYWRMEIAPDSVSISGQ
jgi:hypothetical protein